MIIENVCRNCGISANVLTSLKLHKKRPDKLSFDVSTWHKGTCDYCLEEDMVTEVRDFFHPNFDLLAKAEKLNKKK